MRSKIIEYLKNHDWVYSEGRTEQILFLSLSGNNGIHHCVIHLSEPDYLFAFIVYMGVSCPIEKRTEMVELLNRIKMCKCDDV